MNPYEHSILSVHKFGGNWEEYYPIHSFIDSSKYFMHHLKHRIALHHTFGAYLAEIKFGTLVGKVLVRDIVIEHCKEDCNNEVPTLNDWLDSIKLSDEEYDADIPNLKIIKEALEFTGGDPAVVKLYNNDLGIYLDNRVFGIEVLTNKHTDNKFKDLMKDIIINKPFQAKVSMNDLSTLKQIKL